MTDNDPVRNIWQNQPQEQFSMSTDEIRMKASRFQGTVSSRNMRELVVARRRNCSRQPASPLRCGSCCARQRPLPLTKYAL
jgi:hypothetical protein